MFRNFFSKLFSKDQVDWEADVRTSEARDAEQLRIGDALYDLLKPLTQQNLAGERRIYVESLPNIGGKYLVRILLQDGSHQEYMQEFCINLLDNKLTAYEKYKVYEEFNSNKVEEFLNFAANMVRNFR